MHLIFYIVDVFAEKKYTGNQLTVIKNAQKLSVTEMQRIANEMHYSETTFILSDKKENGGYDVRIFTPKNEIPFAGHPTLGTAYIIKHELSEKSAKTILLNLKVSQIPVTFNDSDIERNVCWMKQIQPTFGHTLSAEEISNVLRLDQSEIVNRYPIQVVSTGLPFIIVPLKTLDALRRARIHTENYSKIIKKIEAKAILIFCPETYNVKNDLSVRVFADYYGVPEDPATGSANGCLAAYLSNHHFFGNECINVRVEQGYEIGRPSLLFLKAEKKDTLFDIKVGGKVILIAKGSFI
jgi:trans-2,3-dihydro-3-hydroxyanthranilate isomerase